MADATHLLDDTQIRAFLEAHPVAIESVKTIPYMGSDIQWKQTDRGWEIALYPPLYWNGPAAELVLLALADIAHRTVQLFEDDPPEVFNTALDEAVARLPALERDPMRRAVVAVDSALGHLQLADYLAQKSLATATDVRRILYWQSERILTVGDAVIFVGLAAVLRRAGGDTAFFRDRVDAARLYGLLPIVDHIETILQERRNSVDRALETVDLWQLAQRSTVGDLLVSAQHLRNAVTATREETTHEYDVAISFAGQDRPFVRDVVALLEQLGIRVFYDAYERANLWGSDLPAHLSDVYMRRARFCVIVISQHYANGQWTNLERRAAQARALQESGDYILPLRLDDTDVDGILPSTGYVDARTHSIREIVDLVVAKLKRG